MAGLARMVRTRGALTGVTLILPGAWGGLVPFIGPYFHYANTPRQGLGLDLRLAQGRREWQ